MALTVHALLFIQPDALPNCSQWTVGPLKLYDSLMVQRHVRLLQGFVDVLALQVEVWARSGGIPAGARERRARGATRTPVFE